jgi:hypothetical protein
MDESFNFVRRHHRLQWLLPINQTQQNDNDGDYDQNVDKTAQGIRGDDAKQPQNDQYNGDGIEHDISFKSNGESC